ncbi:MAG: glyoxalase family protein [Rhodothermales bacterium]|jgi:glyoxalase family protein
MMNTPGIHHVTAIAGTASRNVAFYRDALGLRLVKKTVNFDDPYTYHLYYGDRTGQPGSILTFFPFADAQPGRTGTGMVQETAFSVAPDSLDSWLERFAQMSAQDTYPGFDFSAPESRFGETVLRFTDPDGLHLAFVGREDSQVPHGTFDAVTLGSRDPEATAGVLTDVLGYSHEAEETGRSRFISGHGGSADRIDLIQSSELRRPGAGTVHHVAFRAADPDEQLEWQDRVAEAGLSVTEVKDRQYFKSIYFREPGGVLFEIATDPPGFSVDEPEETMGEALKLPPWLESRREAIAARLPSLDAA